ncbi:MAG: hypothetical protein R3B70_02060 [Polyangiaceae bacterium]
MRTFLLAMLGCCLLVAGCDGESKEPDPRADVGEECMDGGDCKSGLLCFVEVDGSPGECTDWPEACSGSDGVSCDCMTDVEAQCTTGGSSCLRIGTNVTVTCAGTP